MEIRQTAFPDVWLIEPQKFSDDRGYFSEIYQTEKYIAAGVPYPFIQDNLAGSCKGVLRGLHYQVRHAQGKLVRVLRGEIFDVVVDLRRVSVNFGKWMGITLEAENNIQLWIPPGFAHGYYVLSEWAEVFYKVTDIYAPGSERTLLWNDPELDIKWPLLDDAFPVLSEKDAKGILFREAETYG